jgi:hypothetical protein
VLVRHEAINCYDRAHFLAIASSAMRRIVVDHARGRSAQKRRSGLVRLPFEPATFAVSDDFAELVENHDLLEKLARKHARVAQVRARTTRAVSRQWSPQRQYGYGIEPDKPLTAPSAIRWSNSFADRRSVNLRQRLKHRAVLNRQSTRRAVVRVRCSRC